MLLCTALSAMIWCEMPLIERSSGVRGKEKKPTKCERQPNYIVLCTQERLYLQIDIENESRRFNSYNMIMIQVVAILK